MEILDLYNSTSQRLTRCCVCSLEPFNCVPPFYNMLNNTGAYYFVQKSPMDKITFLIFIVIDVIYYSVIKTKKWQRKQLKTQHTSRNKTAYSELFFFTHYTWDMNIEYK